MSRSRTPTDLGRAIPLQEQALADCVRSSVGTTARTVRDLDFRQAATARKWR